MDNYACINFDILAQDSAKQIALNSSGATLSSSVQQQQNAASTLKDFNDDEIVAWLKFAQSTRHIEPIPEHCPGDRHLSQPQVLALSTLKNCPLDVILGWLKIARLRSHTSSSHALETSLKPSPSPGPLLSFNGARLEQSAAEVTLGTYATATKPRYVIPNHFAIEDHPGRDFSRSFNSTRSNNADNHYWCTICEKPKPYKDSGSWKKHEKEHETMFVCGLEDVAESSSAGQSHASKPFTCKRRDIMVNHLNRSHGVLETQQGRDLADQWRHTVKKQAWSCGFCIALFSTFQDRLKHIDLEHFRKHQSIHEWDPNKVILGLLQQPKMEKIWKTRTASLPHWAHPEDLTWDKTTAKDLRGALEIGPLDDHHANILADDAYSASKLNEGFWPLSGTTHANHSLNGTARASFFPSPNLYQATSAPTSGSGVYRHPSAAIIGPNDNLASIDPSAFESPPTNITFGNTMDPAMPSSNDNGRVENNTLRFSPFQGWKAASEPGTLPNGFEPSQSYAGRSVGFSALNWYGQ